MTMRQLASNLTGRMRKPVEVLVVDRVEKPSSD
jgi:hypothetical protein